MSGDERSRAVEGRVALVTGASQGGIGTAIAVRLAAEGALVAISGRSQRGLDDCREQIRAAGWILNLTSFAAELPWGPPFPTNRPSKGGSAYGSSKAALNRLTVALASECEGQGIAVNALTPQAAALTRRLAAGSSIDDAMF